DEGRVVVWRGREQPLDERSHCAREWGPLLDDLLEPGLLSEEVEVGAEDDLDGDRSERVRGLHLFQRPSERFGLRYERLLETDERAFRPDRVGGDREPLEHLIRIRPEQRAVLEGGGLTLRGVADGEPRPRSHRPDRPPLVTGGEAGAAATAEAALRDLFDHRFGPSTERDRQSVPASSRRVLIERSRGQIEQRHGTA